MNYEKHYQSLIQKRKDNQLEKDGCIYVEKHHIIPKSEGGSDDKDNLVYLTAREHFIAHLLLARIYDDMKMWCALNIMMRGNRQERGLRISSKEYELLKKNIAKHVSLRWKGTTRPECARYGTHNAMLGRHHSEETKAKMRAYATGRKHSEETRKKISEANKGRKMSEEQRRKLIASFTPERRLKMSNSLKGRQVPKEIIEKHRLAISKPVVQLTLNGEFVREYLNAVEASKAMGCSAPFIRNCIYGKKPSCKGFIFKFKEDYING